MIRIYGAGGDLIEIEGDIYEEFPHYNEDPTLLAFSDGTLLRIRYDEDGIWRLTPVMRGKARMTHTIAPVNDDDCYSDVVHLFDEELEEPIQWVVVGSAWDKRRR